MAVEERDRRYFEKGHTTPFSVERGDIVELCAALAELVPLGTGSRRCSSSGNSTGGTTKTVTFSLEAQRTGDTIKIAGTVPIVFEEWGIPNPSFGPAQTEDDGVLEFLLVLQR